MSQNHDYEAHTAICIDMVLPGMPITTLGMKIVDAHISDMENVFGLTHNWWDSEDDNVALKAAMANWGVDFTAPAGATGSAIVRLNRSSTRVPIVLTSADVNFGDRARRKRFRSINIHGSGSGTVRVYCDGRYVGKQTVVSTQTPDWARKMNLPRGTTGHTLRYEVTGDVDLIAVVVALEPLMGVP
jgi:hypothetical protein